MGFALTDDPRAFREASRLILKYLCDSLAGDLIATLGPPK
jgi:hypothetical protein